MDPTAWIFTFMNLKLERGPIMAISRFNILMWVGYFKLVLSPYWIVMSSRHIFVIFSIEKLSIDKYF